MSKHVVFQKCDGQCDDLQRRTEAITAVTAANIPGVTIMDAAEVVILIDAEPEAAKALKHELGDRFVVAPLYAPARPAKANQDVVPRGPSHDPKLVA